MKKNIKYLVMAAIALLSMSACTNEMDEQNAANGGELQPVQFQMVTTRTVTDAVNRVTSWKVGDAIGIFALPVGTTDIANAKAANAKYVLGSDNVWKAEEGSEIYPEEALDYYAYYPYQEGVTNPAAINISAKADQSMANGDDYGASDVLAGQTKNVAAGQGNVTLTFKHMFAMVEVKVEGDKVAKQPAKVELKGVKLDAVLDIMAATPAATVKADAEAKDIPMFYLAREGNAEAQVQPFSFRAVVPEQEIAGNTPLVAIYAPDADNKTYTMQHADAVPYKAGVFRQLNVNIGSSKVSLTIPAGNLTISPWEPSKAIGGEGGEVITPITSLTDFGLTNGLTITNMGAYSTSNQLKEGEGWFGRYTEGETTLTVGNISFSEAANGVTVTLTSTAAGIGWNKNAFCYRNANPFEQATYKLILKARPTSGSTSTAGGVCIRTADDSQAFGILVSGGTATGIKGINSFTINTEKEITATFDLTRKTTKMSSGEIPNSEASTITATEAADVQAISIYFYCNTKGGSLDITPVSLTKVETN